MAANTVTLSVNIETAGAAKELQIFAGKAKSSFSNLQAGIVTLNQGFQLLGSGLRKLAGGFDKTVGQAIILQKNIAEVTTLIGDQEGATAQLTNEVLTLQAQYGTSQEQLTSAYYAAISSGAVDATNAMELMNSASKLAIGGATDLDTAVDGLTTVMNAFGKTSKDSAQISDAFFIGMKAGKTTVGELSSNIGQAAGLAATMGVKFEELIASTSALTTGGISTSMAVTQVRSAMVGLAKQTPELAKTLKTLGIDNVQTAIKTEGLVSVLKKIRGTTDGSAKGLTNLFGRVEAVNAIVGLTSDTIGTKFNDIMVSMGDIAKDAGATTAEAYGKMANTISQKMAVLSGKINAYFTKIGLLIGQALIPIIDSIGPKVDELANTFSELVGYLVGIYEALKKIDFKSMEKTLLSAAIAVGIFAGAWTAFNVSTIVTSLASLGTALVAYATAAWSSASATLAMVAPYAAVVGAVSGLVVAIDLLIANWKGFSKIAISSLAVIGSSIKKYFLQGLNLAYTGVLKVAEGMNYLNVISDETLKGMQEGQQALTDSINETTDSQDDNITSLEKTWDSFKFNGGTVKTIINEMSGVMNLFGNEIDKSTEKLSLQTGVVKDLKNAADSSIKLTIDAEVKSSGGNMFSGALSAANAAVQTMVTGAKEAWADIPTWGQDAITAVGGAVGKGATALMATFSAGADATRASLDKAADLATTIAEQEKKIEATKKSAMSATTTEEKKALIEKGKTEQAELKKLTKDKAKAEEEGQKAAKDAGAKTLGGAVGGIVGIFSEGAGAFIGSLIELAKDPEALVAFVKNLIDQLPAIIDGIVEALPDIIDAIIEALPDIITAIIDALPTIFETLAEALPGLIVILAKGIIQLIAKLPAILFGIIKGLFKGIGAQIGGDFAANFKKLFESFKQLNIKLVKAPTEFAIKLIGTIKEKFGQFFEKFKELNKKFTEIPTVFVKKLIQGALDFITKLIEEIKGALPKVKGGGQIGGSLGAGAESIKSGVKTVFGLAGGGVIPNGFPNDSFPAALSSGEVVLNKEQQTALGMDGLNQQDTLNKILAATSAPIQVNATLQLNENAFADIILELNRDNRRLA